MDDFIPNMSEASDVYIDQELARVADYFRTHTKLAGYTRAIQRRIPGWEREGPRVYPTFTKVMKSWYFQQWCHVICPEDDEHERYVFAERLKDDELTAALEEYPGQSFDPTDEDREDALDHRALLRDRGRCVVSSREMR